MLGYPLAVAVVAGVLGAVGLVCRRRMARDRLENGALGPAAAGMIWFVYVTFTALTGFIAWQRIWPLPLDEGLALAAGGTAFLAGVAVAAAGMSEFGSFRRMSGCECPALVRSGIYRWTRNPQNLGWGLALVGIALMGRSGLALALSATFFIAFRLYAPIEERYLESLFGEEWREYERAAPRFILPRKIFATVLPTNRNAGRRLVSKPSRESAAAAD